MNKVYKVIWSKAKNCYVVASELAKNHTKSPKSGLLSKTLVAGVLACVLSCSFVAPVFARNGALEGSDTLFIESNYTNEFANAVYVMKTYPTQESYVNHESYYYNQALLPQYQQAQSGLNTVLANFANSYNSTREILSACATATDGEPTTMAEASDYLNQLSALPNNFNPTDYEDLLGEIHTWANNKIGELNTVIIDDDLVDPLTGEPVSPGSGEDYTQYVQMLSNLYSQASNTYTIAYTDYRSSLTRFNNATQALNTEAQRLGVDNQGNVDYHNVIQQYQSYVPYAGKDARATGELAVVAGSASRASGDKSVAIGVGSKATANDSFAIGTDSVATETNTVSFGHVAGQEDTFGNQYESNLKRRLVNVADGTSASDVATVGQTVQIVAGSGIAVDDSTTNAIGQKVVSIGIGNLDTGTTSGNYILGTGEITGDDSIAVGSGHQVSGSHSGAFGDPNIVNASNSYVIGNNSSVENPDTVGTFVIGNNSKTNVGTSAILGSYNTLTGGRTGEFDNSTAETGYDNFIVGNSNSVSGNTNNVVGTSNRVLGESLAMVSDENLPYYSRQLYYDNVTGFNNTVTESNVNQYGNFSNITGGDNNSFGDRNDITAGSVNAFGTWNKVDTHNTSSVGNNNIITGGSSDGNNYDYGYQVNVLGSENWISGYQNNVVGIGNRIMGQNNAHFQISDEDRPFYSSPIGDTNVLGSNNTVSSISSNIIGNGSAVDGYNNTSIGSTNVIGGENNIALGKNIRYSGYDAVIIGNESAGEEGTVSIGHKATDLDTHDEPYGTALNRKIVNVAAGVNDTDAVNVGQLNTAIANASSSSNNPTFFESKSVHFEDELPKSTIAEIRQNEGIEAVSNYLTLNGINENNSIYKLGIRYDELQAYIDHYSGANPEPNADLDDMVGDLKLATSMTPIGKNINATTVGINHYVVEGETPFESLNNFDWNVDEDRWHINDTYGIYTEEEWEAFKIKKLNLPTNRNGEGAYGDDSIAIGGYTVANNSAIGIGMATSATGDSSVAIGNGTEALADNSVAIGTNSFVDYSKDEMVYDSIGYTPSGVAVGSLSRALSGVAIGASASADLGYDSWMVQDLIDSTSNYSIISQPYDGIHARNVLDFSPYYGGVAVGNNSHSEGNSIAIGTSVEAYDNSVIIGGTESQEGDRRVHENTVVGMLTYSAGADNTVLGVGAKAKKTRESAVRASTDEYVFGATSLGAYAIAGQDYAVALGASSSAARENPYALPNSLATSSLGNIKAPIGEVSLGGYVGLDGTPLSGTDADGAVLNKETNFIYHNDNPSSSILGYYLKRQITNMADGTNASDGATVNQTVQLVGDGVKYIGKNKIGQDIVEVSAAPRAGFGINIDTKTEMVQETLKFSDFRAEAQEIEDNYSSYNQYLQDLIALCNRYEISLTNTNTNDYEAILNTAYEAFGVSDLMNVNIYDLSYEEVAALNAQLDAATKNTMVEKPYKEISSSFRPGKNVAFTEKTEVVTPATQVSGSNVYNAITDIFATSVNSSETVSQLVALYESYGIPVDLSGMSSDEDKIIYLTNDVFRSALGITNEELANISSQQEFEALVASKSLEKPAVTSPVLELNVKNFGINPVIPEGQTDSNSIGQGATGDNAIAIGVNALASAENAVAIGTGSVADVADTVSVGRPEIKDGDTVTQTAINRRIVNVAEGINDTDAVNVGQLNEAIANIPSGGEGKVYTAGIGIQISDSDEIATKNVVMYDGDDNTLATLAGVRGTKLTNLKPGTLSRTSTDAVIGAQLFATNTNIEGFAADIRTNATNITNMNTAVTNALNSVAAISTAVDTVNDVKADISLNNLSDTGRQVIASAAANAVQEYMAANGGNGGALGNNNTNLLGNSNTLSTSRSRSFGLMANPMSNDDIIINNDDLNDTNDNTISQAVQDALDDKANISLDNINDAGISVIRDAVANDLSLKADADSVYTKEETDNFLSGKADITFVNDELAKKADITYIDDKLDAKADKDAVYTKEETDSFLTKKADKADLNKKANIDGSNIDVDAWSKTLATGEVAPGNTGLVNGGAVYDSILTIAQSNPVQVSDNAIFIGKQEKYDTARIIDVSNSKGEGRVMTGVITNPEDNSSVANVGYVNVVGQNIMGGINGRFAQMDNKISEVGANAAAMSGLVPYSADGDEKWALSAAVGHYDSSTAGAVGLFYKPSNNVVVNVKGTVGSDENMLAGGVTVALDKGSMPGVTKKQMVQTINSQATEIQELKAQNKQRDAEMEQMRQQMALMMQEIQRQKSENVKK